MQSRYRLIIVTFLISLFSLLIPLNHVKAAVVINEILPKIEPTSYEWIELYNNGTEAVSLDRWTVDHTGGDKKSYMMNASRIIQGRGFLTLPQSETGIVFDIGGDTVELRDTSNAVVDSQSYPGTLGFNVSVGRSADGGGKWATCTRYTPNEANMCPEPSDTPTPLPTPLPTDPPLPTGTPTDTPLEFPTKTPTQTRIPPTPQVLGVKTVIVYATPSSQFSDAQLVGFGFLIVAFGWAILTIIYLVKKKGK